MPFLPGDLAKFNKYWFNWSSHPRKNELMDSVIELVYVKYPDVWETFVHTSMDIEWHQHFMPIDVKFLEPL